MLIRNYNNARTHKKGEIKTKGKQPHERVKYGWNCVLSPITAPSVYQRRAEGKVTYQKKNPLPTLQPESFTAVLRSCTSSPFYILLCALAATTVTQLLRQHRVSTVTKAIQNNLYIYWRTYLQASPVVSTPIRKVNKINPACMPRGLPSFNSAVTAAARALLQQRRFPAVGKFTRGGLDF